MLSLHCAFVQLQPAVTTGLVSSREQASCSKSGMCLFDGLLEMRVQLGGKQICRWREWIIAIDAVRRWHNFQSPIHLSAVCVCSFGGKAKACNRQRSRPWACQWSVSLTLSESTVQMPNHMCLFPHRFSLHVSHRQADPHCAGFKAQSECSLNTQQYFSVGWVPAH